MRNPADIILELESDNSRLFKESVIIREMQSDNKEFFKGINLVSNKRITFGVNERTVPSIDCDDSVVDRISNDEFYSLVQNLIDRKVTGNAAKDLLTYIADNTSSHTWNNWYKRILLKDLKCGVDVKTINNCAKKSSLPHFSVPVFSCQLAHNSADHLDKMKGEKILEMKLDGSRVLSILYPDGRVDQFTRNGKELLNFTKIKEQLSKAVIDLPLIPMVFDGEVMSNSFQDLMKQLHRKENVQTDDAVLYLFDMITLDDFESGISGTEQRVRSKELSEWYNKNKTVLGNIQILDQEIVDLSSNEGQNRYKEINKAAIDGGYEGLLIKDPYAPYEVKRSVAWLKSKPFISLDLEILDIQEGTDKYEGMLGAFICGGMEDGKQINVNVGSGFTDKQRIEYWNIDIVGRIAEVKADAITQNQNGTYSLRFPVFMRLRGFEAGEKI
jgi:DNA ligase 1